MSYSKASKYKFRHLTMAVGFLVLSVYLVYHAVNGKMGISALLTLSQQSQHLQNELEQLRTERLYLEHRANLMRQDSLDLDLLDEQARKILGYSGTEEIIYFQETDQNQVATKN